MCTALLMSLQYMARQARRSISPSVQAALAAAKAMVSDCDVLGEIVRFGGECGMIDMDFGRVRARYLSKSYEEMVEVTEREGERS